MTLNGCCLDMVWVGNLDKHFALVAWVGACGGGYCFDGSNSYGVVGKTLERWLVHCLKLCCRRWLEFQPPWTDGAGLGRNCMSCPTPCIYNWLLEGPFLGVIVIRVCLEQDWFWWILNLDR